MKHNVVTFVVERPPRIPPIPISNNQTHLEHQQLLHCTLFTVYCECLGKFVVVTADVENGTGPLLLTANSLTLDGMHYKPTAADSQWRTVTFCRWFRIHLNKFTSKTP